MGLDMYLTKKIYVGAKYEHRDVTGEIDIKLKGTPLNINFNRVSEICEEVGYWRKANQIHQWFVTNVQDGVDDCKPYYVVEEDFKQLLADINTVLEVKGYPNEQAIINATLPPTDGFFFGGTDVDEFYWSDLERTKEIITEVLQEIQQDRENGGMWVSYYYQSSW